MAKEGREVKQRKSRQRRHAGRKKKASKQKWAFRHTERSSEEGQNREASKASGTEKRKHSCMQAGDIMEAKASMLSKQRKSRQCTKKSKQAEVRR
jgi:hypothetical protein